MTISRTVQLYLTDPFKYSCISKVVAIIASSKGDDKYSLILDCTPFYPQGGGQQTDKGTIVDLSTKQEYAVEMVKSIDGVVHHEISIQNRSSNLKEGSEVECRVDAGVRELNSRLHSGGHILGAAMKLFEKKYNLMEVKAYHFPDGPYLEYCITKPLTDGLLSTAESRNHLKEEIAKASNEIVKQSIPIVISQIKVKEMDDTFDAIRKTLPEHVFSSPDNDLRYVDIKGVEIGFCCGTHVTNTEKVGEIIVRKLEFKKDRLRVCYSLVN